MNSLTEAEQLQYPSTSRKHQSLSLPICYSNSGSSSCSENNSPTELNQHLLEKPPLVKTVELASDESDGKTKDLFDKIRDTQIMGEERPGIERSLLSTSDSSRATTSANHDIVTDMQCHLQEHFNTSEGSQCVAACDKSTSNNSVVTSQLHSRSEDPLKHDFTKCFATKENVWSPPPPGRHDSLEPVILEEKSLREAAWFQAGIPREIVQELLANEPVGSFMVRNSTSKPGCFALSLRVPLTFQPSGIAHYLILKTFRGYKIKGFTKEFSTLSALITHHSVMPELLPCLLSLSRRSAIWRRLRYSEELVDIDQDPSISLTDLKRTLANLHI
ncbi:EGFR adapter protein-like [Tachypleus tridentatus]|uniref:EGFR adapter protein-like n=1 Tax=Tachypleus tridentatus TaxID=6853 RepID=UPI003FD6443E